MSKKKLAENEKADKERRRYFRIADAVALKTRVIKRENLDAERARFSQNRDAFSMLNTFIQEKEKYLPQRREVERKYPEIAGYFKYLNDKVDILARILLSQNDKIADHPTHDVNLSAQGIRYITHTRLHEDDVLEIKILLFPSLVRIYAFGTVVWCAEDESEDGERIFLVAVDFTYLNDYDQEILAKHIHQKQLTEINRKIEN